MGKHDMTVLPPSRIPAAYELAHNWKEFSKLIVECDQLVETQERLWGWLEKLYGRERGAPVMEVANAALNDEFKAMTERCRVRLEQFDGPEHYEDESDDEERVLKQEVIAERFCLMLGCVDTGPTNTEPEVFARMLVTHVYDINIHYPALLSGCRAIEQDKKPVRTIGHVLDVLQEQQSKWDDRRIAIRSLCSTANELRGAIIEAQGQLRLEQAEGEVQRAQWALNNQIRLLQRRWEWVEKTKQEAIAAYHKYQQRRQSVAEQERGLAKFYLNLAEAKAAKRKVEQTLKAQATEQIKPNAKTDALVEESDDAEARDNVAATAAATDPFRKTPNPRLIQKEQ